MLLTDHAEDSIPSRGCGTDDRGSGKAGRFGDNQDAYEHFMKLHEIMSKGVGIPEDGNQYTVGPWLTFDPDIERCTGACATEANELLKDANRPGFQVPDAMDI